MRKASWIARGPAPLGWVLTSAPKLELISASRLTIPSPRVTGSISVKTRRTSGSRQSICQPSRKSIRRSAEPTSSPWTTVATSQAIA